MSAKLAARCIAAAGAITLVPRADLRELLIEVAEALNPPDKPASEPEKFRVGDCVAFDMKGVVAAPFGTNSVVVELPNGKREIVYGKDLRRRPCEPGDKVPK